MKDQILQNVIHAAKQANIQHMVVVDNGVTLLPQLEDSGVPFTCIRTPTLEDASGYTFQNGISGDLTIASVDRANIGRIQCTGSVCREDLAALCVQCLQSLDWTTSRYLAVSGNGPVNLPVDVNRPKKRVDQQWCINSFVMEEKLDNIA
jgi:hypothetical protein